MSGNKIILTPEQEAWLCEHYADTHNSDCLVALGWQPNQWRTLRRVAKRLCLEKSAEFMRRCQRHTAACAAEALRGVGNGGKVNMIKGAPYRFKPGVSCLDRLGPEREAARLRKSLASRRETIRKERIRIHWGFEQQTKMRLISNKEARVLRHRLKRLGYIVPCRMSKVVYYTAATVRRPRLEARAPGCGITIKEQ